MHYLKDVVTLSLCTTSCKGCGMCLEVCPRDVFRRIDGTITILNRDNCIECGACATNCAFHAVSVQSGVGCATAMINGIIKYGDSSKGTCGCSETGCC